MNKKTFVFLGNNLSGSIVGVKRYTCELLRELDRLPRPLPYEIELLVPRNMNFPMTFQNVKIIRRGFVGKAGSLTDTVLNRLWIYLVFPAYTARKNRTGVNLSLGLTTYGSGVFAIHDCIRERLYSAKAGEPQWRYQRRYLRIIRRITSNPRIAIVTVSEHSKKDMLEFYPKAAGRITVIGNGWEHMQRITADDGAVQRLKLKSERDYFFTLGSLDKHKNSGWIIKTAQNNPQYDFVITCERLLLPDGNELPGNVIFTGYLSDEEMKALMQGCKALIMPSFYEGFGIPPLEALSLGRPVIVSNTTSLPEVFGDSARYIDPNEECFDIDAVLSQPVQSPAEILNKHSWKASGDKLNRLFIELCE